jgi:opacity protein-like surface antigen
MKKQFTLLMASLMLLGASAAQAWTDSGCCYEDPCCEDQTGFYIGGFGGANFISTSRDCSTNTKRDFNTGYVLNASIGYRWCHDVRFEFEYAYRNNQGRHRNTSGTTVCTSRTKHKHFIQNAYMFNGFYDLNLALCNDWGMKPFVGAGIGYVNARNGHHHNNCPIVGAVSSSRKKDKNGFAWQLIAGIAYPICDEIDISLEYRFFKGRERRLYNNDVGMGLKYYF